VTITVGGEAKELFSMTVGAHDPQGSAGSLPARITGAQDKSPSASRPRMPVEQWSDRRLCTASVFTEKLCCV
jgi:hypothetical protein